MINVWAYRPEKLGVTFTPTEEWNRVVKFDTFSNLADELQRMGVTYGQIKKLGIVAHGDTPGVVQIPPSGATGEPKPELTIRNANQYASETKELRKYLENIRA